jgi:uncharacterized protein YcaQ
VDTAHVAAELAEELGQVAAWLNLERGVEVRPNGDLAPALSAAV